MNGGSLFSGLPDGPLAAEQFDTLVEDGRVTIERIISTGQVSDDWYDQPQDEWVCLIAGEARLLIDGEERERQLGPGDWVFLPAHCRHRVTFTLKEPPTIWVAVHIHPARK